MNPMTGLSKKENHSRAHSAQEDYTMKIWNKPTVREQEVGLEVTSYLPAEIDVI